jgi:hypothetical protein
MLAGIQASTAQGVDEIYDTISSPPSPPKKGRLKRCIFTVNKFPPFVCQFMKKLYFCQKLSRCENRIYDVYRTD